MHYQQVFFSPDVFYFTGESNFTCVCFQKINYLDGLVSLVSSVTKCLDFSSANVFGVTTTAAGKPQSTTTPTKWSKLLQKQMGNFTSLVQLMARLLTACHKYSLEKVQVKIRKILRMLYYNCSRFINLPFDPCKAVHVLGKRFYVVMKTNFIHHLLVCKNMR